MEKNLLQAKNNVEEKIKEEEKLRGNLISLTEELEYVKISSLNEISLKTEQLQNLQTTINELNQVSCFDF